MADKEKLAAKAEAPKTEDPKPISDTPDLATSTTSQDPAAPTPEEQAVEAICVVTAANGLNLRHGPGRNFPILRVLAVDTEVSVLELPFAAEVPGWALVRCEEQCGWVAAEHLTAIQED